MKEKVSVKDDKCTLNISESISRLDCNCSLFIEVLHRQNSKFNKPAVRNSG